MAELLLWACFLAVLAGIGLTLRVLVRELQRLRRPVEQPAPEPLVAPSRMTLAARVGAPAPPAPRSGRGLAYLLPSPHASTG